MKRITRSVQPLFLLIILLFSINFAMAQVGINTTTPDASSALDITSINSGILIPRMTQAQRDAIGAPATGLLIYQNNNTPGFYYWDGGAWVPIGGGGAGNDWSLTGNALTGGEFIGPLGADSFVMQTNGNDRMIIEDDGQVLVNIAAPNFATDRFTTSGGAGEDMVNGYATTGRGIYGQTNSLSGVQGEALTTGDAVLGFADSGDGTAGYSNSGSGAYGNSITASAVLGQSLWIGAFGEGPQAGVVGDDAGANSTGVQGQTAGGVGTVGLATTGDGVWGLSTSGSGIYGEATDDAGYGGDIRNTSANGHGFIASGNGELPTVIGGTGAGITGTGDDLGTMGFANNAGGTGIVGMGNNLGTFSTLVTGSGVAGTGLNTGVYGTATETGNGNLNFGGYFENDGTYSYVGGWDRTGAPPTHTAYKILGNGVVTTIVSGVNEELLTMAAPESPEVLFQDYGVGKLINGYAKIKLDPNLSKNIRVD
ncbi:MAG: hypothetical protein KJN68_01345, partial [Bacteroidia bacterium]|nr:hypothetical protein [Bacteroidia bacterium]